MKKIDSNFINLKNHYPDWSSYTCYAVAIMYQWFNWKDIKQWFNQFVNVKDYFKKDKYKILQFLWSVSEYRKEDMFWEQTALEKDLRPYNDTRYKTDEKG